MENESDPVPRTSAAFVQSREISRLTAVQSCVTMNVNV